MQYFYLGKTDKTDRFYLGKTDKNMIKRKIDSYLESFFEQNKKALFHLSPDFCNA